MRTTCILSALTGRSACLTLTSSSPTNKQCVAVEEAEDAVVDAARAVERVAARAVVAVVAAVEMLLPDVAVEGETVAAPSSSVWTTRRRSPPWDK